jgi:CxxC motif-containing protein (DUF1111 family)
LGGDATIFDASRNAFNYAARNLSAARRGPFQLGDSLFNRNWITAPGTPVGNDGLGPTFNAHSCSGCHDGNGRGSPPTQEGEPFLGLLLRLSIPGTDAHGGPLPEPNYGAQLNQLSILQIAAEGEASVSYVELPLSYADGEAYSLRKPSYTFTQLNFGPLAEGTQVSPRLAPQVIGLGLLEAISEDTLQAFVDANARSDGPVRGRINYVWDMQQQRPAVGRFGWKANQPNSEQQTLAASLGDIGITSRLFPSENCPSVQTGCASAPAGVTQPELSDLKADALTTHTLGMGVPARRDIDKPAVRRGEMLFVEAGCADCHVPKITTGTLDGYPELSDQTIRPFTDLLLHDMGEGLADDRPDYQATASEWRTPPLWGIGLLEVVNKHTFLLHDGRARNPAEAILWHDGEAEAAKESFRSLPATDRTALLAFLQSL